MSELSEKLQAMLAAVSFAEEGEVETARWMMAEAGMDRTAGSMSGSTAALDGEGKPIGTMIVTGFVSIALYAALLLHQDEVNATFAKAGAYAVLPIVTAFLFSWIHGTFTGRFWTVLGVEASKKGGTKHHA